MGSSTLRSGTDSWVAAVKPTSNYTKSGYEHTCGGGTPGIRYSFIRFNNPVPRGGTLISVKLHLFGYGNWGGSSIPISLQRVSQNWVDTKVNYNNRPGVTGSVVTVTQTNPASGTEWIFDITALFQAIANGSASNYGFRISTSDTAAERLFYGFQASQYKPYLEVVWSDAPQAPTEMSPAGGASTTLAKPVLTFNFHDVSGSTAMGSCQVQINPTNSFTAPAFDSGEFVTSDPELDLTQTFPRTQASIVTINGSTALTGPAGSFTVGSDVGAGITGAGIPAGATLSAVASDTAATLSALATAAGTITATITRSYAGLSVGGTAYWRVRVKDAAGLWSSWSDAVSFKRGSRGALTLNSPTGGTIQDPTQTVLWTVTGATQTAWQLIIEDDSNPGKPIYDTGRRSGATNAFTLPKGVITREDRLYRLTLRSWDDLSRTATPGDKIHTEVVNTFTFAPTGTADPITNVALVARPSRQPGMYIKWDRASAPDYFEIRRANTPGGAQTVLDTDLLPADLLVSGTTYQWLDRTATPYFNHDWRVIAKVGGALKYGPTITGKFDIDTTWLEDVDTGKLCPILFRDGIDSIGGWEAPQVAVVAQPNAASRVIRITQGQAGLQGSCAGVLADAYGADADTWRANLEWMRDRPDNVLRLSTNGQNLSVVIGDVVIAPWRSRDDGPGARQVSFNFWEQ